VSECPDVQDRQTNNLLEDQMRIERNHGASVQLARLYERVSKNGDPYLAGQFGGAKIAIIKSIDSDGLPVWNLFVSDPVAAVRSVREPHVEPRDDGEPEIRELTYEAVDPF
jgi:hypothetical protein